MLNLTRWLPDELDGQEHCVGLPPSGPSTCTMMMSRQVQLGSTFADGSKGATLSLSQDPCTANPASCCSSGGTCAYWAGAHLVSAGCIQWGVLEIEAAFNMPANGGGFYFTALYVVNGATDGSWNEIDVGMINNVLGSLGASLRVSAFAARLTRGPQSSMPPSSPRRQLRPPPPPWTRSTLRSTPSAGR